MQSTQTDIIFFSAIGAGFHAKPYFKVNLGIMQNMEKWRRISLQLIIIISLLIGGVACGNNNANSPGASARRFAQAMMKKNANAAAQETTDPAIAGPALAATFTGLHSSGVEVKIGQVHTVGATSTVSYYYRWSIPDSQDFQYSGTFKYISQNGIWHMIWTAQDIYPRLGAGQNLALHWISPDPSTINAHYGGPIMVPGIDKRIFFSSHSLDPDTAHGVAEQLVAVFLPLNPTLSVESVIRDGKTSAGATIYRVSADKLKFLPKIKDILTLPGVSVQDLRAWKLANPAYRGFLETVLSNLISHNQKGTNGWQISSIDNSGNTIQILDSREPVQNSAMTVTLEDDIQQAADDAVNTRHDLPTMMIVIQPSTGNILALAENRPAQNQGPVLLEGLYPPGSTFKMVTATATMEQNIAHKDSIVPCPGIIKLGPRLIPNENEFDLGNITMQRAFAMSCNTSFAWLASQMTRDALYHTAGQYGLGVDYMIPGLTSVTGKIIPTKDHTEQIVDGFGQGKDLASPLGMALVAAGVDHDGRVVPQFVIGQPTKINPLPAGLDTSFPDKSIINQLRIMMRSVVQIGTGREIRSLGEIYAKTGEGEYGTGSDAWFAGYRGDLAFATLIASGGSSDYSVRITKRFFEDLDSR